MTFRSHPITDYLSIVDDNTMLIDVREPEELLDGSLPGAINIPVGQVPERIGSLDPAKSIVLFCRSGGRSANAAEFLVASGFSQVTNLEGGMLAWADANQ